VIAVIQHLQDVDGPLGDLRVAQLLKEYRVIHSIKGCFEVYEQDSPFLWSEVRARLDVFDSAE
jgi:hypothetical protein